MSEIFRCLACQSKTGTPATTGTEDWLWRPLGPSGRRAGPFCTRTCLDAWMLWPETEQLRSIFGDVDQALTTLQRFEDGRFVQDMPQAGDILHVLDFGTVKHRNTEANDRTGLPGAVCPNPTQKSIPGRETPDCCPDCIFIQPAGWRKVVAR